MLHKYGIIYIYGPDGSGKSTICKEIVKHLNQKGIEVTYKWMRFNHFLSKIVNAVGRVIGLASYTTYPDGTRIGYHNYDKSQFLSTIYCISTLFDTVIALILKLWLPSWMQKKVIVVDRFIFDIMVDLAVDTNNANIHTNWQGKFLKRLILQNMIPIYISVDKETILRRRPDTRWDDNFDVRLATYNKIYENYGIGYRINNNGDVESALKRIVGGILRI